MVALPTSSSALAPVWITLPSHAVRPVATEPRSPRPTATAALRHAYGSASLPAYSEARDDALASPLLMSACLTTEPGETEALVPGVRTRPSGEDLTGAISAAIVELYAEVYGHNRTTASTYINDNVVVCILENILTNAEQELVVTGHEREVIDGRIAFQADREDRFSAAIERLTQRRVVAFMSANQTSPGIACELFFLAPTVPVT
jgi:uncharacterized protein YbcI